MGMRTLGLWFTGMRELCNQLLMNDDDDDDYDDEQELLNYHSKKTEKFSAKTAPKVAQQTNKQLTEKI